MSIKRRIEYRRNILGTNQSNDRNKMDIQKTNENGNTPRISDKEDMNIRSSSKIGQKS